MFVFLKKNFKLLYSYYGIKVFSEKDQEKLGANKSLGRLIFFLGLSLIIICAIDLSSISNTIINTEQSIWPSAGKGLWIGLFLMAIGGFTMIAVKEQSISSFYILLVYSIFGLIVCFFGLLTSISGLQRYRNDPQLSAKENRNKGQGVEFALSGLLIGLFSLAFLFLSCLSCMICWTIPRFCQKEDQTILYSPALVHQPSPRFYPPHRYPKNRIYQFRF